MEESDEIARGGIVGIIAKQGRLDSPIATRLPEYLPKINLKIRS